MTVFYSPGPSVTVVLATVIGPHLPRPVNVSVVAALFVTSTATVTFWPTVTGPGLGVTETVPRVGATKLNVSAIPPLTSTPSKPETVTVYEPGVRETQESVADPEPLTKLGLKSHIRPLGSAVVLKTTLLEK